MSKTKKLTIRPLENKDYEVWLSAHSTHLQSKNKWDKKNLPSEELTRKKFSALLKNQRKLRKQDRFYDMGVFVKKTGELVGVVSAMDVLRGLAQTAFLGYAVWNRHWGKGYGKEAVATMIDIAFRELKLHRVEAGIEPSNRRSIALARSLGLRREGLKKRAVFLQGRWVDLVMYSATCEEFGIPWKGIAKPRLR